MAFWSDWSDGKKWLMGIFSAVIVAAIIGGARQLWPGANADPMSPPASPPGAATPDPVATPVPLAECQPIRLIALAFDTALSSPHIGPRHEAGMEGLIGNQRSSGAGPDRVVFSFAGPERGACTYSMTVGYATEVPRPMRVTLNETGASVERALAEETGGYGTVKAVSVGGSWKLKTGENHLTFSTYGQGAMPHLSYVTFSPVN